MSHKHTPNAVCHHCGTPFRVPPSRLSEARYCAFECYTKARRNKPVKLSGDGTAVIPLSRGKVAIISAEDVPLTSGYAWSLHSSGYAQARGHDGSNLLLHRLLLGFPDADIDHISGDKLDNRRSNLRVVNRSQNNMNLPRRSANESGYKGVYRNRDRWAASIQAYGQRIHLGTFDTPEEAAKAYDSKALELHGNFARINFPGDHSEISST